MSIGKIVVCSAVAFGLTVLASSHAFAHCDGLDGPVVKAAQKALDTRDPAHVLIWVRAEDEPEVRTVFEKTIAVRALGPQAKELADRFFFETVVRLHRTGEGASYTGLKPAGRDLGPAIPAADRSLERGSPDAVLALLTKGIEAGLRKHFEDALASRSFAPGNIAAGREHVRAYVEFIHYVERLHEAITTSAHGHFSEMDAATAQR